MRQVMLIQIGPAFKRWLVMLDAHASLVNIKCSFVLACETCSQCIRVCCEDILTLNVTNVTKHWFRTNAWVLGGIQRPFALFAATDVVICRSIS